MLSFVIWFTFLIINSPGLIPSWNTYDCSATNAGVQQLGRINTERITCTRLVVVSENLCIGLLQLFLPRLHQRRQQPPLGWRHRRLPLQRLQRPQLTVSILIIMVMIMSHEFFIHRIRYTCTRPTQKFIFIQTTLCPHAALHWSKASGWVETGPQFFKLHFIRHLY